MDTPHLVVDGLFEGAPLHWTQADLAALDERFQVPDLSVLLPRRRGRAVRLAYLVEHHPVGREARWVEFVTADGAFAASLPLEEVAFDALLQYADEHGPLDADGGGPFRLLIPGYRDACANVKHLARLTLRDSPGADTRPSTERAHAELHARGEAGERGEGHACKHDGPLA